MRTVQKTPARQLGRLAGVACCVMACALACASEPAKGKKASKKARPAAPTVEMEPIVVTGSKIPQKVGKLSRTQHLTQNVAVIDQAAIRNSGASTLTGVLRMNQAANWRR
jgi:outer membrane cobalamin receptor